ncbi:hypothetical protein QVD17_24658 [Tagetes erecta]|uniref:Reverse transcriptase zinc-binding domain-containing protein n=1 Tax=Tagetes erecta TaxID=13708 RepID=A0AAD8NV53_TARER|nr:hypothetical protein QVD17_24658 [Tagetes erecta]
MGWINNGGGFSVRQASEDIEACILPVSSSEFQESKWVPSKVNGFAWRALIDRIPCKTVLLNRGIVNDARCPRCMATEESLTHLLVKCDVKTKVWDGICS